MARMSLCTDPLRIFALHDFMDAAMLFGEAIVWNGRDGSDSNVVAAIDLSSLPDCTGDLIPGGAFAGLVQKP